MDRRPVSAPALGLALSLVVPLPAAAELPDLEVRGVDDVDACSVLRSGGGRRLRWDGPVDSDGDGAPDTVDVDDDGDGLADVVEGGLDLDGDGLVAGLDLDSDGDGLPDAVEAVATLAWVDVGVSSRPLVQAPADSDQDGRPDAYDADADDDGLPDALEAGFGGFAPVDVDRDGLADDVDVDPCAWGPADGGLRDPLRFFPDADADARRGGDVDWRDASVDEAAAVVPASIPIASRPPGSVPVASPPPRPGGGPGPGGPREPSAAPAASAAGERRVATSDPQPLLAGLEEDMGNHRASGCSTSGGPRGLGAVLLAALALGSRRKGALLGAVGLIAIPGLASAQDGGLNINGFEQNSQPATFTLVRDARQTERGTISGDLTATYGLNPLEYQDADDINPRDDVIDTIVGLNLGFNAAVTNWLEIGVNMPVLQTVFYDADTNNGAGIAQSLGGSGDRYGVGDLRLQLGLGALQQSKGMPFDLSIIPQLVVPTGTEGIFTSANSIQAGGDLAIGRSWEHFRFSLLGGYMWQDESRRVGDIYMDDTARWGAAFAVPVLDNQLEPQVEYKGSYVVTNAARDNLADFDWHRHTPMQMLFGLTWRPDDLPLYIKGGVGPGLTQGFGISDVSAFLTVGARTLGRKLEVACDTDADGDAVSDCYDVCPYKAEDLDGFQDADGCPDTDNDNDGVADAADACINRPEVFNDYEDADGCPDEVASAVAVQECEIVLFDKVYFEYDRAEIRPVSQRVLDEVATTLKSHPEIQVVELDGHADERGTQWYNLELSRQRAQSVRNYLIAQGIDPSRLTVMAYGEESPAAPNADDEAAYAQNRRVQLKVTTTDQGLALDAIRTADADVPAIPEGFDPPNTDNDLPGQDVNVPMPG